jgi:glycine/D-amino acid oxidase-like deaminating enzyme
MTREQRRRLTPRTFHVHFNRIAAQRGDPRVWSIRTSKGCFHAKQVLITTHIQTNYVPTRKSNPRAFFSGRGFGYWATILEAARFLCLRRIR